MSTTKEHSKGKYLYLVFLLIAAVIIAYLLFGRGGVFYPYTHCPLTLQTQYEDGTYRGIFADSDVIQVNVQFTLQEGIVTDARFRHLRRDDKYNIDAEEEPYKSVIAMYQESLDYLVGKNLKEHLPHLYSPELIVTTEIDGYTSATIRSSKIISAIRDGLNRGVYSYK